MSKLKKSMLAIVPMVAVMAMAVSVAQAKGGSDDGGGSSSKSSSSSSKSSSDSNSKSSSSNAKHTGTDSPRDLAERNIVGEDNPNRLNGVGEDNPNRLSGFGEDNPDRIGIDDNGIRENEVRGEGGQEDNVRANEDNGLRQGQSADDLNNDQGRNANFAKVDDNPGIFSRMGNALVSFFRNIF